MVSKHQCKGLSTYSVHTSILIFYVKGVPRYPLFLFSGDELKRADPQVGIKWLRHKLLPPAWGAVTIKQAVYPVGIHPNHHVAGHYLLLIRHGIVLATAPVISKKIPDNLRTR